MIDMVVSFARTRPGTFLAGSVFVGFAAARFLKSSADRRSEVGSTSASARGGRSGAKRSRPQNQGEASGAKRGASAGGTRNAEAPATAGADRSR